MRSQDSIHKKASTRSQGLARAYTYIYTKSRNAHSVHSPSQNHHFKPAASGLSSTILLASEPRLISLSFAK